MGSTLDPEYRGRAAGWRVLAGLVMVCAAFFAGRASRPSPAEAAKPKARQVLYYADPMHPAYHSPGPGRAPDCGMELQPVYAIGQPEKTGATDRDSVLLTTDQEQLIQIETEPLRPASHPRHVQTIGRVVPDEALAFHVSAGADGWVRRVFSDQTGTQVRKGQALAAFYSRDISAPQQGYVFALESYDRLKKSASASADQLELAGQQMAIARNNLQFIGMGESQIEELERTRRELLDINLTAPADGQILERNLAVGHRFMKGEVLYRIADLSRVWVLADFYLRDSALTGSIKKARVTIEGLPPMEASVARAALEFKGEGPAGRLRLEVDNPARKLLPGMIVNVTLETAAISAMTVHSEAVLDSGTTKHVFVAKGGGRYELREVETGGQEGGRVEIRSGVEEGEQVVTAGVFLLDSESRLRNPGPRPQIPKTARTR